MFTWKTSLIIPTRNRSEKLINLLNNLFILKIRFSEILIIDSSKNYHSKKIRLYCKKKKKIKYFSSKPSTSHQRNLGLKKANPHTFVMFMDDDIVFLKDTFNKMNDCIVKNKNNPKIAGFGFNQIENVKENIIEKIKKIKLIENVNIYPSKPGQISKSGWHSKILNLKKDTLADWVFTTICIFKKEEIKDLKFDESFGRYSYLEDLDFSLNLKKNNKKIYISSGAKFKHPDNIDRSSFNFGIIEIKNRFKIVTKHNLSKKYFIIGCMIRFMISILKSISFNQKYFFRAVGNVCGSFILFKNNLSKIKL